MDSGPSAPAIDSNAIKREEELARQQEKQATELEKQRIKMARGRNGAISLFSDFNPDQNQSQGILG